MTTPSQHQALASRRAEILRTATAALRRRRRRRAAVRIGVAACLLIACSAVISWIPRASPASPTAPTPSPQLAERDREPEPTPAIAEAPPHPEPLAQSPPSARTVVQELTDDELIEALAAAGYRTGLVRTSEDTWLVGDPIPTIAIRTPATPPDNAGRSPRLPRNQR